ncbi:MAG TPA: transglycosylase domain-containing protein, partial [Terriglobales bacterium]|nr:transglycosylase domain-containing protein [Terriglobales bacterium]
EGFWGAPGNSSAAMQLARSAFVTPQRLLERDLLELLVAVRLRQRLSRQEILALYARTVYLGDSSGRPLCGVDEASRVLLDKAPSELTLSEAAWLVSLARAPRFLLSHPDRCLEKRNELIDRMVQARFITPAEAALAKQQPIPSIAARANSRSPNEDVARLNTGDDAAPIDCVV